MTRIPRGATPFKWRRRRQEKTRRWPTLNLVALMDVFTILVFFFLVHSGDDAGQLRGNLVNLPESIADQQPRDTPVITITRENVLLEGRPVIAIEGVMQTTGPDIEDLKNALRSQLAPEATEQATAASARELTIMGDKSIPFAVLSRVMQTCTRAGYGNISLSVLQRPAGAG
jgi:biopolymer transport protein ExbD